MLGRHDDLNGNDLLEIQVFNYDTTSIAHIIMLRAKWL